MKTELRTLIILIAILTTFCSDNRTDPPEPDPDAVKVAGIYEAVQFWVSGDNDVTVDVLAIGGSLRLELFLEFKVDGWWIIPEYWNLVRSGFEGTYEGSYQIVDDSLKLKGVKNFLISNEFIIKKDTLEYKRLRGFAPTIVVLKKVY